MSEDVYTRLREFMDTMPAGFPSTPTGVEIKILKKLFAPEEAELAMKLKKEPEEISAIAVRVGMDESELAGKLEEMAQKGLLFRVRDGDKLLYQPFQFVVGLYEFQLNRLDREFCELFEEYLPFLGKSFMSIKTRQMRVIPVESAIKAAPVVADYNKVRDLVREQETISVAQCICRKEQALLGKECDRPKETCLGFGDFAQYYIDNKMARAISTEEALKLLDQAEESALVLSPSNTQDLAAICCCCPCCCPILKTSKMMPRPADVLQSYYQAEIDPDLCSACGECIDRCQMDAIKEGDDVSEIIDGRCIGCGLCVSTCPEEAISLMAKPDMEAPPKDFPDTLRKIEIDRGALASAN
ncbi:MAG: 4Fe-4S binding protein [Desulfobacteraceae bacterium]|jgi:ferredoxin